MTTTSVRDPEVESGKVEETRFRVGGMDCAACAVTVEKVVSNIDGVDRANVSIGNASMVVEGVASADQIQKAVRKAGYTAQPASDPRTKDAPFWRRSARTFSTTLGIGLLLLAVAASLSALPENLSSALFLLTVIVAGWPISISAFAALKERSLDMNVLMGVAALGAVAIGDAPEAAWVVVLFAVGNTLESLALERSRRSVEALSELAPVDAHVIVGDKEVLMPVSEIGADALLVIRPGERLPLDGEVVEGNSSIDESTLTGEPLPVDKEAGGSVYAGTLNVEGSFTMRSSGSAQDSKLAQVTRLVSDAQGSRAPAERFVDRFAKIYTPIVLTVALLVAVIPILAGGAVDTWTYRALALLIVACPCALVISVPASVVAALGGAAKIGVLIKGGQALEDLASVKAVALDKTGTLTRARPVVVAITAYDIDDDEALGLMAAVERGSEHPLGRALVRAAGEFGATPYSAEEFKAFPGRGVVAQIGVRTFWAGGPRMAADHDVKLPSEFEDARNRGETALILGEGSRVLAVFGLDDEVKSEAKAAVDGLHELGFAEVVMLTGDSEPVARNISKRVGITSWRSDLLPEDKLTAIQELEAETGATLMVGDGVNDAPALAGSTVGAAMGAVGSDVALESADVALMGDDLLRLRDAIKLSRKAVSIMRQNVTVSLASKAVFVLLAPLGYVSLVTAIAVDMGISLLVTLNGLRLLRQPKLPDSPAGVAAQITPRPQIADQVCEDDCCSNEAEATPGLEPVEGSRGKPIPLPLYQGSPKK